MENSGIVGGGGGGGEGVRYVLVYFGDLFCEFT